MPIPDDIANEIGAGTDLPRFALEALATEAYKQDRLAKPGLRRLLGFETSDRIDSFLKSHDVWIEYTREGCRP